MDELLIKIYTDAVVLELRDLSNTHSNRMLTLKDIIHFNKRDRDIIYVYALKWLKQHDKLPNVRPIIMSYYDTPYQQHYPNH